VYLLLCGHSPDAIAEIPMRWKLAVKWLMDTECVGWHADARTPHMLAMVMQSLSSSSSRPTYADIFPALAMLAGADEREAPTPAADFFRRREE